jgi:hypothetical protein
MATRNSTEMAAVYTDENLDTKVAGGAFNAQDIAADVKVALFSFTATADGDGGDVYNLIQLPEGAKVLWASIHTASALMASSGVLTIAYDGTTVGTALTINNTAGVFTTGVGDAPVTTTGAGVVTGTASAHQVNAVAVTGEVYYVVDK